MTTTYDAGHTSIERQSAPKDRRRSQRSLRARDFAVLKELGADDEAQVGFQGLRRRLDLHQQQLARALKRLSADGYVAKARHGYALTERGFRAIDGSPTAPAAREAMPIANALLPEHVTPELVAEALAGRWFRDLRWYGLTQGPGETTLVWTTEDQNATIRLRVGAGSATVDLVSAGGVRDAAIGQVAPLLAAMFELFRSGDDEPPSILAHYGSVVRFAA